MGVFAPPDTTEQILIKLLDHIDELISDDPISKYYSEMSELTMDDVLARQPSFDEVVQASDSSMLQVKIKKLEK
ncbi:hypothetical protein Trco_003134 [Trichoderma cornu-damae]|uniref:Uncharacterized protein n=1 Tax=Trichoderma cornu-damae TaxID=654480 RepID=A0A9P8TYP1_9HYPO|nr:hypothetical protein Trco_003134 [Trichoderma cornu-damae]